MSFSDTDYQAAAARLGVPVAAIKAVAEVEAGGATLAGMATSVVGYWVGSSNGSMQKNAALERALAQK